MHKINKRYVLWTSICALFLIAVFVFSYLYPYTEDEYLYTYSSVKEVLYEYFLSYQLWNPRIGLLAASLILYFGKWSFLILNPLVQLSLVLAEFYFVFLRLPDFKEIKDIIPFSLLAIFALFAVSAPDNTLFWIGGACNYSWALLPFMLLLCGLRHLAENKNILPNILLVKIIALIIGFFIGMSNENNSPMALLIMSGFWLYARYKRLKMQPWFYWVFAATAIGAVLLFSANGSYNRANFWEFAGFVNLPLTQKLFMHINHIQDLIAATFYTPAILAIALPLAYFDKNSAYNRLKDKNLLLSLLCFATAAILAFVLFLAPRPPERAFYSASVFFMLSFVFFLKYINETFKTDIYKIVFIPLFAAMIAYLPLFTLPYADLYRQDAAIKSAAANAVSKGQPAAYVNKIKPMAGPTKNLTIFFLDYTEFKPEIIKKHFGVYLK